MLCPTPLPICSRIVRNLLPSRWSAKSHVASSRSNQVREVEVQSQAPGLRTIPMIAPLVPESGAQQGITSDSNDSTFLRIAGVSGAKLVAVRLYDSQNPTSRIHSGNG